MSGVIVRVFFLACLLFALTKSQNGMILGLGKRSPILGPQVYSNTDLEEWSNGLVAAIQKRNYPVFGPNMEDVENTYQYVVPGMVMGLGKRRMERSVEVPRMSYIDDEDIALGMGKKSGGKDLRERLTRKFARYSPSEAKELKEALSVGLGTSYLTWWPRLQTFRGSKTPQDKV